MPLTPYAEVADVGTAHITAEDADLLDDGMNPIKPAVMFGPHGWLIWTRTPTDEMRERGLSDAFLALIERAKAEGFVYLYLDSDGATYADLPTFDW